MQGGSVDYGTGLDFETQKWNLQIRMKYGQNTPLSSEGNPQKWGTSLIFFNFYIFAYFLADSNFRCPGETITKNKNFIQNLCIIAINPFLKVV